MLETFNTCSRMFAKLIFLCCLFKLESHWDATKSRLVGDKGLRYKCVFLTIFTMRSLDFVTRHSRECLTIVVQILISYMSRN